MLTVLIAIVCAGAMLFGAACIIAGLLYLAKHYLGRR